MTTTNKPKVAFWIIAIIALIWNAMGVMAYIGQAYMTDDAKALLPEAQRELYENVPAWATAAFAIAVFGGLLGSLALIIKKKWAIPLFLLSLLGVLVQMVYNFFLSNNMDVYGPGGYIMPIMVIIIAIFLYMYSKKAKTNGWLN
ncbi:MAG: hypothetical protein KUG68_02735 [Flavobacteriaceae bacterium]|nr:hypothetical protein [Flavobacteriaceae bacterium]